jgi:hypothetical protein
VGELRAATLAAETSGVERPPPGPGFDVAPIGGGNALTLPAQRHLVRIAHPSGQASYLLAAAHDGREGLGLHLHRSDDEGRTWRSLGAIQPDFRHRDTADLVQDGMDIALVYSYEAPKLGPSDQHDVYFQWWRYRPGIRDWTPEPPVRVFDSTANDTGYYRAELVRDSQGRWWVQAFSMRPDGQHEAVIAVSRDHGKTFVPQPVLDVLPERGGGRILSVGARLILLYDMHDAGTPARMRTREDTWALERWTPVESVLPEGIYHGAALSAVPDLRGGFDLSYKDERDHLWFRHFDGQRFGEPTLLEDTADWALQSALTRREGEDTLVVFYNRALETNARYTLVQRTMRNGVWSAPEDLDRSTTFKGYLTSPAFIPAAVPAVPCAFGATATATSPGAIRFIDRTR